MSDMEYITRVLLPEFLEKFGQWNSEYPGERPLGAKAEWHGIHRKVGKLKRPIWDGEPWTGREDERTMFLEIIGHAFLAIASLDEERSPEDYPRPKTIPDLLRHNMERCEVQPITGIDYAYPDNPLIGMTETGMARLRRLRAEAARQAQMDKTHPPNRPAQD